MFPALIGALSGLLCFSRIQDQMERRLPLRGLEFRPGNIFWPETANYDPIPAKSGLPILSDVAHDRPPRPGTP